MIRFLEMITILVVLVIEFEYLIKGKRMYGQDAKTKTLMLMEGYPKPMLVLFTLCSIGYLILAICWVLSSNLVIRIAGLSLVSVSIVSILWKKYPPLWWDRIDRIVSMIALVTVGYVRFRAL